MATFIAELQAGRFDSETAKKCLEEIGPWALLTRAIWHTRARDLPAARRDRDAALAAAPHSAQVHLIAGILGVTSREHARALRELRQAMEMDSSLVPRSLEFSSATVDRVHWSSEAGPLADEGIARDRDLRSGDRYLRTKMFLLKAHGMYDEALAIARSILKLHQSPEEQAKIQLEVARLAGAAGHIPEAAEAARAAVTLVSWSAEVLCEAGEVLVEAGAFAQGADLLRDSYSRQPSARAASRLAELKLWGGDLQGAMADATRALELDHNFASAHRTVGICRFAEGRVADALASLDVAVTSNPRDVQAYLWRARVRLQNDPTSDGWQDFDRAAAAAEKPTLPVELLRIQRILVGMLDRRSPWQAIRQAFGAKPGSRLTKQSRLRLIERIEPILPALEEPFPEAEDIVRMSDGEALQDLLTRALDRLGWNYSDLPTIVRDGKLQRAVQPSAREEASAALQTIATLPPAEVRARLDAVIKRYPGTSRPLCYLGELCVWLGEVKEAREHLERVITRAPATRWAYVGLAACDLIENKPENALEVLARCVERLQGTSNASLLAHRGEALRRLGRLKSAREDLRASLNVTPQRLSGWINLGLTCAAEGDTAGLEEAFNEVRSRAPGLISDAAEELGEMAWGVADAPPSAKVQQTLLERALTMMRGNRSSALVTYFLKDGRLRCEVPAQIDLAASDAADLDACELLLSTYGPKDLRA